MAVERDNKKRGAKGRATRKSGPKTASTKRQDVKMSSGKQCICVYYTGRGAKPGGVHTADEFTAIMQRMEPGRRASLQEWVELAGASLDPGCRMSLIQSLKLSSNALRDCQERKCAKATHELRARAGAKAGKTGKPGKDAESLQSLQSRFDACMVKSCPQEVSNVHHTFTKACVHAPVYPPCAALHGCNKVLPQIRQQYSTGTPAELASIKSKLGCLHYVVYKTRPSKPLKK